MQRLEGESGTDPRRAEGRTLPQLLQDRVREHGSRVAMRRKRHGVWQPTSWAETWDIVGALATALRSLGIDRGDRVAIISENIPEAYWLEYAAQCCGAAVVCLYPDAVADELRYILQDSGARMLLAEDQEQVDKALAICRPFRTCSASSTSTRRGLWHEAEPRLIHFPALLELGRRAPDPAALHAEIAAGKPSDPAVICYTSGTTGLPKGVVLSHDYLLANAYRLMAGFRLRPHTQYLSYISPAWAAEQICGVALGLLAPMTVDFAEKPETVREDMRELGPEFLMFTPRQWEMLAADVDATMLDAPAWRQSLYRWALRTGGAARRTPRPRRHPRQAGPVAHARRAQRRRRHVRRGVPPLPRPRRPARQPLRLHRIRPHRRALVARRRPGHHGPAPAQRPRQGRSCKSACPTPASSWSSKAPISTATGTTPDRPPESAPRPACAPATPSA